MFFHIIPHHLIRTEDPVIPPKHRRFSTNERPWSHSQWQASHTHQSSQSETTSQSTHTLLNITTGLCQHHRPILYSLLRHIYSLFFILFYFLFIFSLTVHMDINLRSFIFDAAFFVSGLAIWCADLTHNNW